MIEKAMKQNELQYILEKEYGIQVYREELSEEALHRRGYRKATRLEAERYNAIFQYAPHIAKDLYYADAVQKSFDSAVKGSFRVKIEPGLHLGQSHTTEGAFKGNLYDANGKLKSQADWLENAAKLDVSMAPQIASSFFNVTSFITGQYFMSQINRGLSDIKTDTEKIKQFLEDDKNSTIQAAIDELNEIVNHLPFIAENPDRVNLKLQRLSAIQATVNKYINMSQKTISSARQEFKNSDKGVTIKKRINSVVNAMTQYRVLVDVYCQSKLIEIYLNKILNTEELTLYRDELNHFINSYTDNLRSTSDWINNYLNENRSLNNIGAGQILAMITAGVAVPVLRGDLLFPTVTGLKAAKKVYDFMDSKRQNVKAENVDYAKELMKTVSDVNGVKEPVRNLTRFIEASKREIEIIKIGEEIYTSLPG